MSTSIETKSYLSDVETKKQILLQTNNLSLRAGERQLLSSISLTVSTAEIVTVIGPNGAGKSTLVRAISGLIRASSGEISLFGQRIDRMPTHRIVK